MRKKIRLRYTPDLSTLTPEQREELDTRIADTLHYIFTTFPPEAKTHEKRTKDPKKNAQDKFGKLQSRRDEFWISQETAKAQLEDAKTLFGRQLVAGEDVAKLSSTLSERQAALDIFAAGLAELDSQIATQKGVVAEAEVTLAAAETSATMKLILKDAVALIKVLGNAQVDIHRNIERSSRLQLLQQHRVRGGLHNIGWDGVANLLQQAQQLLETAEVMEKSKVPNAMSRGGYIDEANTQKTLGSAVRDWARQEVSR